EQGRAGGRREGERVRRAWNPPNSMGDHGIRSSADGRYFCGLFDIPLIESSSPPPSSLLAGAFAWFGAFCPPPCAPLAPPATLPSRLSSPPFCASLPPPPPLPFSPPSRSSPPPPFFSSVAPPPLPLAAPSTSSPPPSFFSPPAPL